VNAEGKYHRFGKNGVRQRERADRPWVVNPPDAWIVKPDSHEPLIDRDTFERVQARLRGNQTRTTPHPGGGNFVLNRLLVCSHCGSFLHGLTHARKRQYICGGYLTHGKDHCKRHWVAERPLVNLLLKKLQQTFLDPDNLKALRAEIARQQEQQQGEANVAKLQGRQRDLQAKIDEGTDRLFIVDRDRIPGMTARLRQLEKEQDAVKAELHRIKTECPVDDLEKQIAEAESVLWRLREAVQAEDFVLLRELLRQLVHRVELRWTDIPKERLTRCQLEGGVIVLRTQEGLSDLSPLAGR
jgi:hypothetical protein